MIKNREEFRKSGRTKVSGKPEANKLVDRLNTHSGCTMVPVVISQLNESNYSYLRSQLFNFFSKSNNSIHYSKFEFKRNENSTAVKYT